MKIIKKMAALVIAMVMVAAAVPGGADVVMDFFAGLAFKHSEYLYRMVHRAFVKPEPHGRRDVNHQQQYRRYLACGFHL